MKQTNVFSQGIMVENFFRNLNQNSLNSEINLEEIITEILFKSSSFTTYEWIYDFENKSLNYLTNLTKKSKIDGLI